MIKSSQYLPMIELGHKIDPAGVRAELGLVIVGWMAAFVSGDAPVSGGVP